MFPKNIRVCKCVIRTGNLRKSVRVIVPNHIGVVDWGEGTVFKGPDRRAGG